MTPYTEIFRSVCGDVVVQYVTDDGSRAIFLPLPAPSACAYLFLPGHSTTAIKLYAAPEEAPPT